MGRLFPFVALSVNDRYVRGAVIHFVVFAWVQIPPIRA